MSGFTRGISVTLGGWLWADILLGLFVIFVAANSVGAPPVIAAPSVGPSLSPGIDQTHEDIAIAINSAALLGTDKTALKNEQDRILKLLNDELASRNRTGRVALAYIYANHERPNEADTIASLVADTLEGPQFKDVLSVKTFHRLVPGDQGTQVVFELWFFQ